LQKLEEDYRPSLNYAAEVQEKLLKDAEEQRQKLQTPLSIGERAAKAKEDAWQLMLDGDKAMIRHYFPGDIPPGEKMPKDALNGNAAHNKNPFLNMAKTAYEKWSEPRPYSPGYVSYTAGKRFQQERRDKAEEIQQAQAERAHVAYRAATAAIITKEESQAYKFVDDINKRSLMAQRRYNQLREERNDEANRIADEIKLEASADFNALKQRNAGIGRELGELRAQNTIRHQKETEAVARKHVANEADRTASYRNIAGAAMQNAGQKTQAEARETAKAFGLYPDGVPIRSATEEFNDYKKRLLEDYQAGRLTKAQAFAGFRRGAYKGPVKKGD
jgi:hypothetical protein